MTKITKITNKEIPNSLISLIYIFGNFHSVLYFVALSFRLVKHLRSVQLSKTSFMF